MLHSSKTSIRDWLVWNCKVSLKEAVELENELREKCFIESVGSLRQCVANTPDVLDCLKLSKSFEYVLFSHLKCRNSKALADVTVSEVSIVLQNIFPDHPHYSAALYRSRVSGFVLSTATTCQRLMELGINDKEHALSLLGHLSTWNELGVPHLYLRATSTASEKSHITMLPRKRARDENLPPNIDNEHSGGSDILHSDNTPHFVVSTYTNKLISSEEKIRLDALTRLIKEVEKDKNVVNTFLHTGLLSRLLNMRNDSNKDIIHKMLFLLNLVIQRGDDATLTFLILYKKLIEEFDPKMWSLSHRVRMEIVRILLSVANTTHYLTLLQPSVVQNLVNVYFLAINDVRGRDAEEVRHRFALCWKALCLGTQNSLLVSVLKPCLSVLKDILATDHNSLTTLPVVCSTICHLLQLSTGKTGKDNSNITKESDRSSGVVVTGEAFVADVVEEIGRLVLPPLTTHLSDQKDTTILTMLSVLSTYAACCRPEQLTLLLSPIVLLQKLLVNDDSSLEVKHAVVKFCLPLCHQTGPSITLLTESNVFPVLLQIVMAEGVKNEFSQGAELEQDTKLTAARAFISAIEGADDHQLPYFLTINVYNALLKIIARIVSRKLWQDVLLQTLRLLRMLILRVDGIDEEDHLTPEDEQCEVEAWMVVQRLSLGYYIVPVAECDDKFTLESHNMRQGNERKGVCEEVKQAAAALVKTARSVGILEVA